MDRGKEFPIGASVTLEMLERDPYPIYRLMQESEPVSWVAALNMYYVVRYSDVEKILQDPGAFTVGTEQSTLFDTFGTHMLTVEDPLHARYKSAFFAAFQPSVLRGKLENQIRSHAAELIDGFAGDGAVEFRSAFAARLPILTMLSLFGLPLDREGSLRTWYDSFERALSNFNWDRKVRDTAKENVHRFRMLIRERIAHFRRQPDPSALLSAVVHAPPEHRLEDDAIEHNALIILFGGISTVEALILNALHALSTNESVYERVRKDPSLIRSVIEETVRWAGPVQSATRHVVRDVETAGVAFRAGDTVNCMIAAANRDPRVFAEPDRFDIGRSGLRRQLGFAAGPHHCLGSNLAKLESRIALEEMMSRLPGWQLRDPAAAAPRGSEFRQPRQLQLAW